MKRKLRSSSVPEKSGGNDASTSKRTKAEKSDDRQNLPVVKDALAGEEVATKLEHTILNILRARKPGASC